MFCPRIVGLCQNNRVCCYIVCDEYLESTLLTWWSAIKQYGTSPQVLVSFLSSPSSVSLLWGSLSVPQQRHSLLMWHRVKGHVKGDQSPAVARDKKAFNKPNHLGASPSRSLFNVPDIWHWGALHHSVCTPWICCIRITDGEVIVSPLNWKTSGEPLRSAVDAWQAAFLCEWQGMFEFSF